MCCVGLKGFLEEEARSTVSFFHGTHHCSLQCCAPRNNYHIPLMKSVHSLSCCFKASIFAHSLVQCCNRVGKAPSNTNHSCTWQLRQELHRLVLEQAAQSSLLAFSFLTFLSAHCWSLLNSHQHLLQKKSTEHRRSEQNVHFNPQLQ